MAAARDKAYKFAVPSSAFTLGWVAHAAAVSSVSWIDSPQSLLSSSADGLAKIWAPDGSTQLGQVSMTPKATVQTVDDSNGTVCGS